VQKQSQNESEAGFMLMAVVVMAALILVALAVAAPAVARDLRRDKEVESEHRANEYLRAIQLYYRKNKSYPPSIKALENTNNIRYLRKQYVDPLTGKSDWKMIHQGEQQTKIHVFFGKELGEAVAGLGAGAPNLGAAGGMPGTAAIGPTTVNSSNALNAGFGGSTIGGTSGTSGTTGSTGATGSSSGTGMFGDSTGGIIVGLTTARSGTSILNPNQQTTYDTWEFWYDPRIELLKQSVNITGGGMSSQSASSFGKDAVSGQSNGTSTGTTTPLGSGFGTSSPTPTSPTTPTNP
jgi:type II secretory pathway pseudopilin PulG